MCGTFKYNMKRKELNIALTITFSMLVATACSPKVQVSDTEEKTELASQQLVDTGFVEMGEIVEDAVKDEDGSSYLSFSTHDTIRIDGKLCRFEYLDEGKSVIMLEDSTGKKDECKVHGICKAPVVLNGGKLLVGNGIYKRILSVNNLPSSVDVAYSMPGVKQTTYSAERKLQPTDKKEYEPFVDCQLSCHITIPDSINAGRAVACLVDNFLQHVGDVFEKKLGHYHGRKDNTQEIASWSIQQFKSIYDDYLEEENKMMKEEEEDYSRKLPTYFTLDIVPVWMSEDKTLITFQTSYSYDTTGLHGMFGLYYLTYDLTNDKVLGWKDIIRKDKTDEVRQMIDRQVCMYKDMSYFDFNGKIESDEVQPLLVEKITGDRKYPRPALVGRGLVFSYQPYWIASFSEGDLHFIVDYKDLEQISALK